MNELFSIDIVTAGISLSAPLIIAALGGMFSDQSNMFNIALESFMLFGAFFSVVGCYFFQNAYLGVVVAALSGIAIALVFALMVVNFKSEATVVGIALNMAAWGATSILLELIFNVRGHIMDPRIRNLPTVNIPLVKNIPVLNKLLSGYNLFVYFALAITILVCFFTYKTKTGLRIRALGQNPNSLSTAGANITKYKYIALIINGALCGIAGAGLTLTGLSMFSENMTAGKGFIALAAVMLAGGRPVMIVIACIIFGIAESMAIKLQGMGIPPQLVGMLPYIITMLVLFIGTYSNLRKGD